MKIMKPVFLCVAGVVSGLLSAEDLTVEVGQSVTVSENATYDNVTVNGALAVADGVTLTANTSFVVANGINGTATVTLGEGSTVEVKKGGGTKFGVGAGRAEVTLGTGAYFNASGAAYVCYGYDAVPSDASAKATEAALTLGELATFYCGTELIFGGGKKPSGTMESVVTAWVRLNNRSSLSVQRITDSSYTSEIIEFNGGQVTQRTGSNYKTGFIQMPYAAKNSYLYLDSIDGQEVRFYLPGAGMYSGFTSYGSKSCRIFVRGEGAFRKTGVGEFKLVANDSSYDNNPKSPNLRFLNEGELVIAEGGFILNATNILQGAKSTYTKNVDVRIESGGWLDLGGMEFAKLGSVEAKGSGLLKNSGAEATLLTVGESGKDSLLPRIEGAIDLVKTGAGKMMLCADELASLDIRAGSVEFLDREHMGYPFYRFQVDAHKAGFNSNTPVRVNELSFMNKGSDVTRPYVTLYHNASGSSTVADPVLLVDGDLSTYYNDMRACYNDERLARVGVTLEYADCQPIDGYRLALTDNAAKRVEDPTAWRVFGGFSKTNLVAIDQVNGFEIGETRDGWVSPDFTLTYPATLTRIPTLKIASNVKVKAVGGTVVSESFTSAATGLDLDLSSGATLPLTANQSVAKIAIDLDKGAVSVGVLNPEATGAIYLTGDKRQVKGDLLRAQSCENAANFKNWSVYVNGVLDNRRVCFENGALKLPPYGIVLVVR